MAIWIENQKRNLIVEITKVALRGGDNQSLYNIVGTDVHNRDIILGTYDLKQAQEIWQRINVLIFSSYCGLKMPTED